ncbi:MAG: Holliday junction DNA helicase RuvB [Candidatus Magasanikbacteria bacterium RIFOXYD2_FULL_41_14]|uniref:Holliday junction branch migration complex subunit RuvB n=1 Tax=Candidatus Magasanikbacteria bacterium RIFOXYD2_FULL_41_14 TaxID=1798709 RepID=A0A1F6PDS4_9BACT|nr:MAG: Holliday junction DNA helicase RuvB [Candidatus Magasanikbacteria bacterium RIFOXYD2_FULL_41_14]
MTEKNQNEDERLTAATENPEEVIFDNTLRPKQLGDFVGQDQIKQNLSIAIEAAKQRDDSLEHIILYGNPGLGKTTLAHIIAREMGANIRVASGPTLEKVGDLAAILSNLQKGDVLFIDEIHRLNKTIAEVLYPALEDFALDIIIGQGPTARTLRMPLAPFTLIGATTKLSLLPSPLRDRFGHVFHLNFYEPEDIKKIIKCNANILDMQVESQAADLISARSRRTPRIANRLLKRVRDFAQVHNASDTQVKGATAKAAMDILAIDEFGLDNIDRALLNILIEKFNGGPTGLNNLAAAIAEEMDTIETVYEPFLLQIGFLERTPRGRKATRAAYDHLGFKYPKNPTLI